METRFVELIDTLYEASVDSSSLGKFISDLSQLTDSAVGGIYSREDEAGQLGFVSSYGASTDQLNTFEQASQFQREFCRHLTPAPSSGSISYTQDVLPGKKLRSEKLYSDFLEPQGLGQANCLFIEHDRQRSLTATFMRDQKGGIYDAADKALFQTVMPHLQRSFKLRKRTHDLQLHQSQVWDMLDMLPYGVIVFSNQQKVMYFNQSAEQMTFANDGLALNTGNLSARVNSENKQLRYLLKSCVESTQDPRIPMYGGDMLVSRPSGKRAYSLMVNPISSSPHVGGIYPAAIVVVHDHERETEAPIERLRALHDLTPAEARVAHQVALGNSLEVCAENLGHTVSTSRNLLKRVFAKTDTGRQNELVSVLLRSPLQMLTK